MFTHYRKSTTSTALWFLLFVFVRWISFNKYSRLIEKRKLRREEDHFCSTFSEFSSNSASSSQTALVLFLSMNHYLRFRFFRYPKILMYSQSNMWLGLFVWVTPDEQQRLSSCISTTTRVLIQSEKLLRSFLIESCIQKIPQLYYSLTRNDVTLQIHICRVCAGNFKKYNS